MSPRWGTNVGRHKNILTNSVFAFVITNESQLSLFSRFLPKEGLLGCALPSHYIFGGVAWAKQI